MTKEKMLDNIIKKWGFENPLTIDFAFAMEAEEISEKALVELYKGIMEMQGLYIQTLF